MYSGGVVSTTRPSQDRKMPPKKSVLNINLRYRVRLALLPQGVLNILTYTQYKNTP